MEKNTGTGSYAMKEGCLLFALACARPSRLNFLFDFRRKGMRESGPFLSIFSFYLFFFFLFLSVFLFSVFSFSCCSFFRGHRPPKPQKTMRRASQPSALVNQNLYETKTRAHFIIVGGERNTAFIRICADCLPCALFWILAFGSLLRKSGLRTVWVHQVSGPLGGMAKQPSSH